MKIQLQTVLAAAVCGLVALAGSVRADELAEKGRQILAKNQGTVVTISVVVKVTNSGRSNESKQDCTGTVVDPSGLTVVALSSCDPSDMYRRMYDFKGEIEVADVKILLEDGTEVPAEIVLRDKDLDLGFIRPKVKPTSPMAAVDLSKSSPAQTLDQAIVLNRLNRAAGRAYSVSVERISAVISKPRTFYIPDSMMTATTSGSPAFALDGNILGLFVVRAVGSTGGTANPREGMTSIILPAEDILKGAKQAPEAKGDDASKDAPKETPKEDKK